MSVLSAESPDLLELLAMLDVRVLWHPSVSAHTHAAGLPYLLRVLPEVLDAPLPEIVVLGIPATADEEMLDRAARLSLEAVHGGAA
jgi:hypothetical protein